MKKKSVAYVLLFCCLIIRRFMKTIRKMSRAGLTKRLDKEDEKVTTRNRYSQIPHSARVK